MNKQHILSRFWMKKRLNSLVIHRKITYFLSNSKEFQVISSIMTKTAFPGDKEQVATSPHWPCVSSCPRTSALLTGNTCCGSTSMSRQGSCSPAAVLTRKLSAPFWPVAAGSKRCVQRPSFTCPQSSWLAWAGLWQVNTVVKVLPNENFPSGFVFLWFHLEFLQIPVRQPTLMPSHRPW